MILEEETFDAFGYYVRDLKPQSDKLIFAACDKCGKVRITSKYNYRALCKSCAIKGRIFTEETKAKLSVVMKDRVFTDEWKANISASQKGKILTEEHKANLSVATKGNKNHFFGKKHTEETRALMSTVKKGKYMGEDNGNYKDGQKASHARSDAKRRRELGYTLLMPLKKGEEGHHVTDEYVIGIPAEVHHSFSCNSRKKHRIRVLQWLKTHDKKKYKKVLCVLALQPL